MLATQSQLLIRLDKKLSGRYYKQLLMAFESGLTALCTYLLYGSVCYDEVCYIH